MSNIASKYLIEMRACIIFIMNEANLAHWFPIVRRTCTWGGTLIGRKWLQTLKSQMEKGWTGNNSKLGK